MLTRPLLSVEGGAWCEPLLLPTSPPLLLSPIPLLGLPLPPAVAAASLLLPRLARRDCPRHLESVPLLPPTRAALARFDGDPGGLFFGELDKLHACYGLMRLK